MEIHSFIDPFSVNGLNVLEFGKNTIRGQKQNCRSIEIGMLISSLFSYDRMGVRLKVAEIIVAEAFFQCFDRYRAWKPKTFVSLFKHLENGLLQNTDFRFFKISVKTDS